MDCLYERKVYYCVCFVTTRIKDVPAVEAVLPVLLLEMLTLSFMPYS